MAARFSTSNFDFFYISFLLINGLFEITANSLSQSQEIDIFLIT